MTVYRWVFGDSLTSGRSRFLVLTPSVPPPLSTARADGGFCRGRGLVTTEVLVILVICRPWFVPEDLTSVPALTPRPVKSPDFGPLYRLPGGVDFDHCTGGLSSSAARASCVVGEHETTKFRNLGRQTPHLRRPTEDVTLTHRSLFLPAHPQG